ncbi:hypothetical protein B0T20DRAFT_359031 [Sordaria brevicollis]|uniref:Uncharacterized protein n=1 Tax=Sordaria brevicollis TaxID=83679 RepID=A0AAE0P9A1_SORBR|nr:hypothetical protein B0T20DRAFT_359031 [Sordaria brevicollis]
MLVARNVARALGSSRVIGVRRRKLSRDLVTANDEANVEVRVGDRSRNQTRCLIRSIAVP